MATTNRNPHTTVKKGRLKQDPVTINAVLQVEDGIVLHGNYGLHNREHDPIRFKITISDRDLDRLATFCNNDPDMFSEHILAQVFVPAITQLEPGARGVNKGREIDVSWMKYTAGRLYPLFVLLCNRPIPDTPTYFQKLVKMLGKKNREALTDPDFDSGSTLVDNLDSGRLNAAGLTAYCLEKLEGEKRLFQLGIKRFFTDYIQDDPSFENFRNRYIRPKLKKGEELIENRLRYYQFKCRGATYVTKKGEKRPLAFNELTPLLNMIPCDEFGKELPPLGQERHAVIRQKAEKQLLKNISKEKFFSDIFKQLSVL